MMEFVNSLTLVFPEIILLATACITLLAHLFFAHRAPSVAFNLAIIGLLLATIITVSLLGNSQIVLFNGLFVSDDRAQLMKLFIEITVMLCFIYSKNDLHQSKMASGDFYVLGLFSTLGMMALVSAHSLLSMYLGLELLSLPVYAMTAMQRSNGDASEAAMKYIVMGAIASGLLLYGMSLLYGATGTLDLEQLAQSIQQTGSQHVGLLSFALVFIVAGVGFKCAVMPFHMWVPDVYAGAPSCVTLFIGSAPKIAALAMTLQILTTGLPALSGQWQPLILFMALLSTGAGNLFAMVQTDLKRLLGYSSIAHMGYALFGLLAATPDGYAAAVYYVLMYGLMSAAALGLVVILSKEGHLIQTIDDLKGLGQRSPWFAFMMLITLLSMAGIPPAVGFFTKFWVLKALVDVQMTWVAAIGLVFAVMGAFYYLRIIKIMYFDTAKSSSPLLVGSVVRVIYSAHCMALLVLGIFPSWLMSLCEQSFSS